MEQVLDLLRFEPAHRSGEQWYGRCPLHASASARGRSFSVNVAVGRYFCHRCRSHGNPLELWAAATKLPLHQAAIDLCHRLGRDVPWIRRW
jgi:DNA primase